MEQPIGFNEKILWRKLHDRRKLLVSLQDKIAARDVVSRRCPDARLTKMYVAESPKSFPCIVKPNNKVRKTFLLRSRSEWDGVKKQLDKIRNKVWGKDHGEWAYSQIPFRLMFEEVIPIEFEVKLYCFDGDIGLIRVVPAQKLDKVKLGRPEDAGTDNYDKEGNRLPVAVTAYPPVNATLPSNLRLKEVVGYSERISKGIDFVRIDFFWANGEFYFNEFTVYPGSGLNLFKPYSFNYTLGRLWRLPQIKVE